MNLLFCFLPFRCRIRILDSFGTEAEFNYGAYRGSIPGGRSPWANADLNLRQIFTMFRKFTLTMCFARSTVDSSTSRIVSLTCKVISPDLWLKEQGIYTHIAQFSYQG